MNLLLIDPPRGTISKGTIWGTLKRSLPTLGLAYIAAYLEAGKHRVSIIDLNVDEMGLSGLLKNIRDNEYELIGITATTVQINSALLVAHKIKDNYPAIPIVFGGPHPNVMLEEVLRDISVDYIVRGEGELTMLEIANKTPIDRIAGISYKKDGKIIHNANRPFIENLDSLPFPARHLIPMNRYSPTLGNYKRLPAASMITSRGCPGRCTFCNTDVFGKTIRFRSAKNIVQEVESLIKNYNIKEISFYDDTFTVNKKNVEEFCSILIEKNIDITWSCMSRLDCVSLELLEKMHQAGCHSVCYGIESSDEGILANINKKIPLHRAKEVLDWTKKAGIEVRASFMLGNPGETEETIRKTIEFAIKLNPDTFLFNITTPFPGTQMFNWAKENNLLTTTDWDEYDLGNVVMRLPTVTPEVIKKYYKEAYRRAYIRPAYILQRLDKIRSIDSLFVHLRLLKGLLLN